MTEAGKYRGIDPDGVLETEADHFMKCPGCGQKIAVRSAFESLILATRDPQTGPGPPLGRLFLPNC